MPPCVFCVVCCAFVRCALCVLLVCSVWVFVCVGVGVGVGVGGTPPPPPPPPLFSPSVRSKRSLCVHSKRPRVYRHHARKCYHMRAWCRYTRGRFECTHRVFSVPHHTARTHHDHNDIHTGRESGHRGFGELVEARKLGGLSEVRPEVLNEKMHQCFPALRHIREAVGWSVRGKMVHGKRVGKTSGMTLSMKEQWQEPRRAPTGP